MNIESMYRDTPFTSRNQMFENNLMFYSQVDNTALSTLLISNEYFALYMIGA